MQVEIVAIGTELLLGLLLDTNSGYIAQELSGSGIDCYFQTRVGDNVPRIKSALEAALSRNDAVICCGGLGPTSDDVTREALAALLGTELVFQQEIWNSIESRLTGLGRKIPEINKSQAMVPKGATPILQTTGTAPGLICPIGDKVIYATPGVPAEMKEMLSGTILADLRRRSRSDQVIVSKTLRTWGLPESQIAELISERIDRLDKLSNVAVSESGNSRLINDRSKDRSVKAPPAPEEIFGAHLGIPTIAFLASNTEGVKIRIAVKSKNSQTASAAIAEEEEAIKAILKDFVFATNDETMEEIVAGEMVKNNLSLSVAESLTGGLLSARIVSVPGASSFFKGGLVSYATEVKHQLLSLEGPVVSEKAAVAMAEGVRRLLGSDIGLATTGVAGPTKQEDVEPGTVYIGLATDHISKSYSLSLTGSRERIRQATAMSALDVLRRHFLGN